MALLGWLGGRRPGPGAACWLTLHARLPLVPLLQAYMSGHDHNLEALRIWRDPRKQQGQHYSVLVSGGGSATQRGQFGSAQSRWFYPWSGFAAVSITPKQLTAQFYTLEGEEAAWTETIERGAAAPPPN